MNEGEPDGGPTGLDEVGLAGGATGVDDFGLDEGTVGEELGLELGLGLGLGPGKEDEEGRPEGVGSSSVEVVDEVFGPADEEGGVAGGIDVGP